MMDSRPLKRALELKLEMRKGMMLLRFMKGAELLMINV
jgi:hypothetical protein